MNLALLTTKSILYFISLKLIFAFECSLPNGCFIHRRIYELNEFSYEKTIYSIEFKEIKCKPDKGFQFRFIENDFMANDSNYCTANANLIGYQFEKLVFEWPKHGTNILENSFNLTRMLDYLVYFKWYSDIHFNNLSGFEIDLSGNNASVIENSRDVKTIICVACTINFYTNGKLIKSCDDIESNSTIMSILQIRLSKYQEIAFDISDYPTNICPLVFKNSNMRKLFLMGLADTFYKKNILKFTNDVFNNLNSTIYTLQLEKVESITLDLTLLNPSVFKKLQEIVIYGALKSLDKRIFRHFPDIWNINFQSAYFRKFVHENGVDWINDINKHIINIDVSNKSELNKMRELPEGSIVKLLAIQCTKNVQQESIMKVLPDEDFCIYKDFPFNQLVILMQFCNIYELNEVIKPDEFTCTYLWLNQYLEFYYEYYALNKLISNNIKKIIESKSFKERSKCNFEHRLELCNKTNYKIENIWSNIDYYYLNKKLQISFKITSYLISLFGIASNLITVIIIVIKSNSELFKEFKQYTYLCINSVFCLMILVINILSWTTECFYPFQVFCPEIRKVVFFQFFKIIFKECLTTTFRFMLNFSYMAFALNRIAIIKKDQNKLLKFISELSIKWYIGVSLIISAGLSAMKFFKYEVNYEYPFMNYPISNEWDIFNVDRKKSHTFDDAYFIMNSISDIINYVIFVLICVFIDIYMVVELRQVMADKLRKIKRIYAKSKTKVENTKKENDVAMNKAKRMVLINTAIGFLFKMPISFIPILNVYAAFYYKDFNMRYIHPSFGRFYSSLFFNGFYGQFSDFADFLFILSISIQPLIYKHFDKKIQIAFLRLFLKNNQPSIKSK